ncbi:DUF2868 domain-containing protein [Thiocapsa sp.]|uniref:DUF2868 domain-containing protein n=1 Tax=Thiocapsa sp. TaxID=2024551 RepID=UPI002BD1B8D0|nr:DUF2868 domain-containing protein [Thiocapsa sp.]HSO82123.1 DUF2868 domain-containing protein [Thiocapsa sp.]
MDFRHHPADSTDVHAASDEARDWTVADLIDFEYYLDADERELREHPSARKTLAERDRSLYLDAIAPEIGDQPPHTPAHRRFSLRRWLAARRNAERPEMRGVLPGAAFASAERWVTILLALVGFIAGIGVASALLSYDGTRPVSVSWYLFLLVIVQFLLVASIATAWALRKARGRGDGAAPGLLMHVVRPLVTKAASWLQRQRIGHAAAEIQDQARARQGLFKSQYVVYGPVSYLPLIIPAQIFGVAFNVGVILTTLMLEWFTDLAFGWGSTLNVHPQTIFDMTRLIALPWSWLLGEGIGYPSLEQVAGSRIFLEHWASVTPTLKPDPAHLRSWGSFLVLSVTTYGLLPRLLLWGGSVVARRLILARLPFTHSRTQALYARMLSPRLETTPSGGRPGGERGTEMPIPAASTSRKPRSEGADSPAESASTTSARPWRNALVRRVEPGDEAPTSAPPPPPVIPPVVAPPVDAPQAPPAPEPVQRPVLPREVEAPSTVVEQERPEVAERAIETPESSKADRSAAPSVRQFETERVPEPEPEPESEPEPPSAPEPAPSARAISEPEPRPEPKPEPKPEEAAQRPSETQARPIERPAAVTTPAGEPKKAKAKPAASTDSGLKVPEKPPAQPSPQPQIAETPTSPPEPAPAPKPAAAVPTPPKSIPAQGTRFAPDACLLLLHVDIDDILEDEDRPRLEQMLMHLSGWRVAATATVGAGSAMTEEALGILERGDWQAPPPRVVLIEDGSQPPITESLRFLRELRAAAGTRAQIMLALVGDPTDDDRLPPMRPFDYTDWQRKIDQMADPYLRLEMLAPPHEDGDD